MRSTRLCRYILPTRLTYDRCLLKELEGLLLEILSIRWCVPTMIVLPTHRHRPITRLIVITVYLSIGRVAWHSTHLLLHSWRRKTTGAILRLLMMMPLLFWKSSYTQHASTIEITYHVDLRWLEYHRLQQFFHVSSIVGRVKTKQVWFKLLEAHCCWVNSRLALWCCHGWVLHYSSYFTILYNLHSYSAYYYLFFYYL